MKTTTLKSLSRLGVLLLTTVFAPAQILGFSQRMTGGFTLGLQPNYGQGFITQNTSQTGQGQGLDALNYENADKQATGISRPVGIELGATMKYILADYFFLGLDLQYATRLIGGQGKFIVVDDSIIQTNGGKPIVGRVNASLQNFQTPLTMGTAISFWEDTLLFAGAGAGYSWYKQSMTLDSGDDGVLAFKTQSSASGNTLIYHFFLEAFHQIGGFSATNPTYLTARFQYQYGNTAWVADQSTSGENPRTILTGFHSKDAQLVDLSGWRFSLGFSVGLFHSSGGDR